MSFDAWAIHEPGEPQNVGRPTLNDDLSIRMDELDGDVIGPVCASSVVLKVKGENGTWNVQDKFESKKIQCFATEARFAFLSKKWASGPSATGIGLIETPVALAFNAVSKEATDRRSRGSALAGHVRYPWIWLIQFGSREFLSSPMLRVYYSEEIGARDRDMYVTFVLDDKVNAAGLAYAVMQRVVRCRLGGSIPKDDDVVRELHELLDSPPVVEPKGKLGDYWIPGSIYIPRDDENAVTADPPEPVPEQQSPTQRSAIRPPAEGSLPEIARHPTTFPDVAKAKYLTLKTFYNGQPTMPSSIWAVPDGDRLLFLFEEGSSTVAEVRKDPRVTLAVSNLRAEQLSDPVEVTAAILDRSANDTFFRAMAKRHGLVGRWFNFCNKHRSDTSIVLEMKAMQR